MPSRRNEAKNFLRSSTSFRRYARCTICDYLMIVAQAYQESELDQTRRGPSGGVGLMQIKPSTRLANRSGSPGWTVTRTAMCALGAPISGILRILLCSDPAIDAKKPARLMSFAAYNAGPHNLKSPAPSLRQTGLDRTSGSTMSSWAPPKSWGGLARPVCQNTLQILHRLSALRRAAPMRTGRRMSGMRTQN